MPEVHFSCYIRLKDQLHFSIHPLYILGSNSAYQVKDLKDLEIATNLCLQPLSIYRMLLLACSTAYEIERKFHEL